MARLNSGGVLKECKHCGTSFITTTQRQDYCTPSHRIAAVAIRRRNEVALSRQEAANPVPSDRLCVVCTSTVCRKGSGWDLLHFIDENGLVEPPVDMPTDMVPLYHSILAMIKGGYFDEDTYSPSGVYLLDRT